jgi:hypothetical protein
MAINIDTQDLVNYPGTTKRVTLDQDSVVPVGEEGDEKYILKTSTTAYSDNTNSTAIQDLYITDFKTGWCKSSGFAGSGGKFSLDSTHYQLKIKLDATVSGSDDSGYYTIALAYNIDSTPISGDAVAANMEEKIRALTMVTADTGYSLSYKSCSVYYQEGKFWIISGSTGNYYTGANRSSVKVAVASLYDCSKELGFDLELDSEALDAVAVKEAILGSDYTTDTTPLTIGAGTGVTAGDCLMITDGVYTDYFVAISGTTDVSVVVATNTNNSYVGIANSYTTASGALIQKLRRQDPEGRPTMWYTNIDAISRFGIKSIINQIDYSS